MLTIRNAQLDSFARTARAAFEARLVAHMTTWFPDIRVGVPGGMAVPVTAAVDQALAYGFDRQRDICKFLNLQCRFGWDFDADPDCAWAHPLLRSTLPGPAKMERLYALALQQQRTTRDG
jgi:hypothetical protein